MIRTKNKAVALALLMVTLVLGTQAAYATSDEVYTESFTMPAGQGTNITIDVTAVNVTIGAYDGDELTAVFDGRRTPAANGELPKLVAVAAGSTVTIKDEFPQWSLTNLTTGSLQGTLTVQVPKAMLGGLTLEAFSGSLTVYDITADRANFSTSSGSIDGRNLAIERGLVASSFSGNHTYTGLTAGEVSLEASSGNIACDTVTAGGLDIDTFSGRHTLQNAQAADIYMKSSSGGMEIGAIGATSFTAETFSGAITLEDITLEESATVDTSGGNLTVARLAAQSLDVKTFSGKIALTDVTLPDEATLDTSSGSLTVNGLAAQALHVKSFSGKLVAKQLGVQKLVCDMSSGDVDAAFTATANVQADTFSGDVHLTFPADTGVQYTFETFSGKANVQGLGDTREGTLGNGSAQLNINTSGGDLKITFE